MRVSPATLWRSHSRVFVVSRSVGYTPAFTTACSTAVAALGCVVLVGWLADVESLKSVIPGFVEMNPLTAICFVFAGVSLWVRRKPGAAPTHNMWAFALAAVIVAVGITRLSDYFLGTDVRADRWLFTASLGDNQMAPNTAVCFLLTGLGLLSLEWITARGGWPGDIAAVTVAFLASVSLVGYGYGASGLYRVGTFIPMALNTGVGFLLISTGMLLSRPQRTAAKVLFHPGQGGMMARWLIPIGIFVPIMLGWFRVLGQEHGWYETEFGAAFMVVVTVTTFTAAVLLIANRLNYFDEKNIAATLELKRKNQDIQDLYDNAPCGYHSLGPDGAYIAVNKTELSWLGYDRDELVGKKKFSDVITPAGMETFISGYQLLKDQGYIRDLEFEMVRKDGTTIPIILNSTAILSDNGTFLASRTTLFDATERKRIETTIREFNKELEKRVEHRTEQLRRTNAELLEKTQENEMFVYSVSHDLRSPLVNLQGFSQELEEVARDIRNTVGGADVPELEMKITALINQDMHRCIRFIQTSVSRLSGIIDALLRLSRAGRVEYVPCHVDLNQLMARIVESMSAIIYDRGANVRVGTLPTAWGDPTALEQIFANLIGNAVNYLDPTRPGQIAVGHIPGDSRSVTYFVKDNGLGIAADYHNKVFQALKRLHPSTGSGEGIGLALVKRMVERHNGTIWFESTEGVGSTFFVRLPSSCASVIQSEASPTPQSRASSDHDRNRLGNSVG